MSTVRFPPLALMCLGRLMPVFSPIEWRITGANPGLYLVEKKTERGWRLEAAFFDLARAFAFAERLHGPVAGLAALCGRRPAGRQPADAPGAGLPERYRVCTEASWRGRIYQNAAARNPFGAPLADESGPTLSPEDAARFIASRFAAAGRYPETVDAEAVVMLARLSGGALPALNLLAGAAVFLADLECSPRISRRHVEEAVALHEGGSSRSSAPGPARRASRARAFAVLPSPALALSVMPARLGAAVAGAALVFASSGAAYRFAAPTIGPQVTARFERAEPVTAATSVAQQEPTAALAAGPHAAAIQVARERAEDGVRAAAAEAPGPDPRNTEVASAAAPDQAELAQLDGSPDISAPQVAADPQVPSHAHAFRGPVKNETMHQSGKLALVIMQEDPSSGIIRAKFHASDGLLGTGELAGTMTADGHISASGQLMMGKNPFLCNLSGSIQGGRLTGSAQFVRPWGGRVFDSNFSLSRS